MNRAVLVGLVVVAAAVPGVALWSVAEAAAPTAARGEPAPAAASPATAPGPQPVTPVLSARRVPATLTGRSTTSNLVPALQSVAARIPANSCLVGRVGDRVLVERSGGAPVIPASTTKLFTAAAALEVLGADHRFTTTVAGTVTDGVAPELYLVGGGDPNLTTQAYVAAGAVDTGGIRKAPAHPTSLDALADQVKAAGVRKVGRLVGDESAFDAQRTVPAWGRTYPPEEVGPLSALLVDDGLRTYKPPATTTNPPLQAAQRLAELLRQRGVTVDATATGTAPAGVPVVTEIASAPLSDVVSDFLTWSDNTTGELLVKALGKGTTAGGLAVVRDRLAAWGMAGVTLNDGSGLARSNVVSCSALAALLTRLGPSSPVVQGMAVAGRTGTLAGPPLAGTPAEGRLRAKTGSLSEVKALAGTFLADGAAPVEVALVVQGPTAATVAETQLWPALADALGTYPYRPDLSAFLPLPAR